LHVNCPVTLLNHSTPCPEKDGTTLFLRITLPNAGQFSKNLSPADLAVNF